MEMTPAFKTLLASLRAAQRADGLSDAALARQIGISKQQLSRVLDERECAHIEPTVPTLRGIVRAYPRLVPQVLAFITADQDEPLVGAH